MQLKILSKRELLLIAILIGLTFFAVLFLWLFPINLTQNNSPKFGENTVAILNLKQANSRLPVRLKIPIIGVDTFVEHVGLTPEGAMDVPKEHTNVAWLKLGSYPGENGSAVIAGHYGWKDEEASAFDNLYKLKKGDKVYIEDGEGTISSFLVRESRRYNQEDNVSEIFSSSDGESHLNLITCGGVWDKVSKTYSDRLVVFTDRE